MEAVSLEIEMSVKKLMLRGAKHGRDMRLHIINERFVQSLFVRQISERIIWL